MILRGTRSYLDASNHKGEGPEVPRTSPDEARLCQGVVRIQAAFREVMEAVSAANGPPPAADHAPSPRSGPVRRDAPPPGGDPEARRKWEIDAALDFAFSELERPLPKPATPEEIAATLDEVLPEEKEAPPPRAGARSEEDVFVIPYDFELRCLLNLNQGQVNPQWIPAMILWNKESRNEKN